jgi:hypothetical protein
MEPEEIQEQMKEMAKTVGSMAEAMKGLSSLGEVIQGIKGDLKELKQPKKETPKEDFADPNLELMSRAEFQRYILKQFEKILDDKVKPIGTRVEDVDSTVRANNIARALEVAQKEHRDFMEWKEEMIDLTKRVQGISPEEAYQLVVAQNPKKAAELKDKYKSAEEKAAEEEVEQKKKEKKAHPWGGLTPTSGEVSEEIKNLSKEDAANLAWEKVFGDTVE